MKRKPTHQQERFIEAMANPETKNHTQAAIIAGCPPKNARITACQWLTNANISDEIQKRKERALAHHQVRIEEVIGSAAFQMRSSIDDLLDENGSFSIDKARLTGAIDLIKRHKEKTRTFKHKTGWTETVKTVEVEIMTNQDGRKEVANYIGLNRSNQMFSNLQKSLLDRVAYMREIVAARARDKNISYQEELKNYLEKYAAPEIKEILQNEIE